MDKIEEMLGWKPDRETRIRILREAKESGKCIQEIIGSGTVVPIMPEMAILDENLKFNYRGQMITVQEWEKINPLGKFGHIIVIGNNKIMEKYKMSKNNGKKIDFYR
ncbi:hypothetical protein A2W14_02890 [Candidatus Gottesmanbacteria bacterium RBG_16_37_8]|uniref:Uncharacterized protein n=1 Tax=Candidatus Gottesmanbacteria bacterium RBG_16_37_8 TaxID=1798371 RepID=A0A1F5YTY7_9BACT|nr:MAG: hypothetical protein A2W14_02890 [Candidatus Gottesmanbacteria bacterium RBG_16_37_8]